MLDNAGFKDAIVMASDSLNIASIHQIYQVKEAPVDAMGIGGNYANRRQDTKGISAVMKAAQVDGRDLMKFSNSADKATLPGVQDVLRMLARNKLNEEQMSFAGDIIVPLGMDVGQDKLEREIISIPRRNPGGLKPFPIGANFYRPIVPVMRNGAHLLPSFQNQDARAVLTEARERFFHTMKSLEPVHKQIINPRLYGVGIEEALLDGQAARVRGNILASQRKAQLARFAPTQH
jgi:nicotinic acid phosphoribosyltransferase